MTSPQLADARPPSRARFARVALHLVGLLVAGAIAWLLWQGYRQPELILDLANFSLC